MDKGHSKADKALVKLEKDIKREYTQAYNELKVEAQRYFDQFAGRDKQMTKMLKQNQITKDEYLKWRKNTMLRTKQYESMLDDMANVLVNTDKVAADMMNGTCTTMFMENYNYGHFEVASKSGLDLNFGLYSKDTISNMLVKDPTLLPPRKVDIPKDLRWNRQKLNSALTQGILKGESVPKIAKRLQGVTNMDRAAATRNARTMMTSAQNSGRQKAYADAQEQFGIEMGKKWIATIDDRTRQSHIDLDGEVVGLDEQFSNEIDYPGDPSGEPSEVYNCRCTMVCEILNKKYADARNMDKLPKGESYEEWKARQK